MDANSSCAEGFSSPRHPITPVADRMDCGAESPQRALELIDGLADKLAGYPLVSAVRGDLLARLGRTAEARGEFERAAALTRNAGERLLFSRRAAELG